MFTWKVYLSSHKTKKKINRVFYVRSGNVLLVLSNISYVLLTNRKTKFNYKKKNKIYSRTEKCNLLTTHQFRTWNVPTERYLSNVVKIQNAS